MINSSLGKKQDRNLSNDLTEDKGLVKEGA